MPTNAQTQTFFSTLFSSPLPGGLICSAPAVLKILPLVPDEASPVHSTELSQRLLLVTSKLARFSIFFSLPSYSPSTPSNHLCHALSFPRQPLQHPDRRLTFLKK